MEPTSNIANPNDSPISLCMYFHLLCSNVFIDCSSVYRNSHNCMDQLIKMNAYLLHFTLIALTTGHLISCVKYHHICDCGYFDVFDSIPGKYNITFICTETCHANTLFTGDRTAICKKNDYHFYKIAIGSVSFQDCELHEIEKNIFDIYYNVHSLNISHLNIDSLPHKFFKEAKNLVKLFATHNRLSEIPPFWFHNLKNLTEVNFSFNEIKEINDLAFFGDLNLKKVNLSNNQLTILNRKLFEDHSHLTHLDVSSNRITEVISNLFQGLRNLVHLDLSNNPIESIDNTTFLTLVKLQYLNLSHTSLKEIKSGIFLHQINLQILDLSKNHIEMLDADIFSPHLDDLELLNVEDNPLELINGFSSLIFSKIVGIESEKFKCIFLKTISEPISWKELEKVPRKIKCILNGRTNKYRYLTAPSEKSTTSEWLTTKNEMEVIAEAKNETICKELHAADSSQHILVTTWINSVCLVIGVIVLILTVVRKQMIRKMDVSNVFYRKKENETLQTTKNTDCEAIINK